MIIGAGQTFIAGADIREFAKIVSGERPRISLYPFLRAIEDCPKPVVMAIHGAAFGGGLETAMAGHYRVIAPDAQVGQPEVKLGLIPGAGGTQRLPRLAGVAKAVEMCAGGQPVQAREAVELGIADRLIEGALLEGAIAFAREVAAKPVRKTRDRNEKLRDAPPVHLNCRAREGPQIGRGMTAPLAAIDAVEAATRLTFDEGCRRETELFDECLYSPQSVRSFTPFSASGRWRKFPALPKDMKPAEIGRAAVIGAGTMGGGIAMTFANAGIPVIVKETAAEALERGMDIIRGNYSKSAAKGRLSQADAEQRLARITPQSSYEGFDQADIIVEAVFENTAVKKQVFAEIGKIAKPAASWPQTPRVSISMRSPPPRLILTWSLARISSARRTSCVCSKWCAAAKPRHGSSPPPWRSAGNSARLPCLPEIAQASSATGWSGRIFVKRSSWSRKGRRSNK